MIFLLAKPPHLILEFAPKMGLFKCVPKCVIGNKTLWDVYRHHMKKGGHVGISLKILCRKTLLPTS